MAKAKNSDLRKAMQAKKDEFYTQMTDIEKEMRYYTEYFKGKTIICNADDPFESNFFKFFALNFNRLGLKKLITTCFDGSPVTGTQLSLFNADELQEPNKTAYRIEITEVPDANGDGAVDLADVEYLLKHGKGKNILKKLNGNGDFRSPECVELLKQADCCVTNGPFSLFREQMALLQELGKDFIILGNMNAIHYKEIFKLFQENKIWLGPSITSGDRMFYVPDDYPLQASGCGIDEETGRKYIRVKGVRWYTNIEIPQRHEELVCFREYSPDRYPKYDNYDAIEVGAIKDIPSDYYGKMGVPDTFLQVYNPDQFKIIGLGCGNLGKEIGIEKNHRGRTDLAYTKDGKPKCPYSRIIVQRRKNPNEN